jgi:hypothetical protein
MNSEHHDIPQADDRGVDETPRPLRFWLKTVARLIAQESASTHDGRDVRSRIADAVPAEDYATTVATLEAIARELGWDGEAVPGRGPRGGYGHRGHRMHDRAPRYGAGGGRSSDAVHVHVHLHGDREHRGDRHRGHDHGHRRGRCAPAAG